MRGRNALKGAGLLGLLEGFSAYIGPRLLRPPSGETTVTLPSNLELIVPPNTPSYRNYATGLYETDVTRLLLSLVANRMTFVDIGANIGYYTLQASRLVGVDGRVYAFEPDDVAYSYLVRNVDLNRCVNVAMVHKAAGTTTGVVNFVSTPGPERGFVSPTAAKGTPVEQVSLDDFFGGLGWPPISVIKIDTEGAEGHVLMGMAGVIQRNPEVRVVMELNSPVLARAGSSLTTLIETLHGLGFRAGYIIEQQREVLLTRLLPGSRAVYNLLLSRRDP